MLDVRAKVALQMGELLLRNIEQADQIEQLGAQLVELQKPKPEETKTPAPAEKTEG